MPVAVMMRRTLARCALGSMPMPVAYTATQLAASGSLTVEHPIEAGAKLKLYAWRRQLPNGDEFLSLELRPFDLSPRRTSTTR